MARFTPFIYFILLAFPFIQVSAIDPVTLSVIATSISIVTGIITLTQQISENVEGGMRYLGEEPETNDHYKRPFNPMHSSLMDQLRYLSRKTDLLKTDLGNLRDEIINQVTEKVPALVELNRRLSEIFVKSVRISKDYDNFMTYYDQTEKFDKNRMIQFANKIVSDESTGITHMLEEIHTRLVLTDRTSPSAVTLLYQHVEFFMRNAKIVKSPQQLFYDLLNSIIYVEIKGYLTIKYSYNLLQLYKQGNFKGHIDKAEYEFGRRLNLTVETFKNFMNLVSREVWRNNPPEHIEDVTYTKLKHVFQKYVINEYDISNTDQCKNTCSDYKQVETLPPRGCGYRGEICDISSCKGYLYDCQFPIKSNLVICPSGYNSNRRYEYIDHSNGLRYGDSKQKCSIDTLDSKRHFYGLWWCEPCMCVCADYSSKAERQFNLEPVFANSAENYVITGARLVKRKQTIHIQIQEGQLLPNGKINASTLQWSKINEHTTHLHILQWKEAREIHLDDLIAYKRYALTGLAFMTVKVDASKTERLKLQAYAAPIDFYSGKVISRDEETVFKYEFILKDPKNEIKLDNLDIPTRTSIQTVKKSAPGQFLKFEPTGLEKDVGQSTIPFIDIQDVTTSPAVPMSGVGIYHKSRADNGGFLALRLYSYDYAQHLHADLPEDYKSIYSIKESEGQLN